MWDRVGGDIGKTSRKEGRGTTEAHKQKLRFWPLQQQGNRPGYLGKGRYRQS